MAQKTNSFERFWKELKRRKVVHVITVYAAVAFVILQLVDIVADPLRLPESTKALVIVLLCIGFVIAVFVSWIYDITPAGVKKTKPVSELKHVDQATAPPSSGWKIATFVSVAIIAGLVAFNFFSRGSHNVDISKLEKSIAVLPFINDSPSDSTTYFINGVMEEILNNLQKIGAFSRVLSRTSTEQYRGTNKPPIPKIAKELDVNYIVEGSGQKYGSKFVLRVQLIVAKNEKHLWGESFEREIKETNDIIDLQSQIARTIAEELKVTITPEEKKLIEIPATTNLTAYDFYQRGREEFFKSGIYGFSRQAVKRAEFLFHKALEYDSTFAKAYFGLGMVIVDRWIYDFDNINRKNLNNYLDSSLFMAEKALSYNNKLAEAYLIRGFYYSVKSSTDKAVGEFEKALKYNPGFWQAYWQIGSIYEELSILKSLQYFQKAASLSHGTELIEMFNNIGLDYYLAGFPERGNYYLLEALKLDSDSVKYKDNLIIYTAQTQIDFIKKADEYFKKRYLTDSINEEILCHLGYYNSLIGNYQGSLKYYKKYLSILKANGETIPNSDFYTHIVSHIGYAYLKNRYKKEAEFYFDRQIETINIRLTSIRPGEKIYYLYPLAGLYLSKGDKDKAYKNLKILIQNPSFTLEYVMLLKNDPMFNSIRSEPEFQQIVRDVEAKYQAEHERLRKWLEETGQL
jgi:TolB-like protein/tetratricopeptide (TPR) repeat protein